MDQAFMTAASSGGIGVPYGRSRARRSFIERNLLSSLSFTSRLPEVCKPPARSSKVQATALRQASRSHRDTECADHRGPRSRASREDDAPVTANSVAPRRRRRSGTCAWRFLAADTPHRRVVRETGTRRSTTSSMTSLSSTLTGSPTMTLPSTRGWDASRDHRRKESGSLLMPQRLTRSGALHNPADERPAQLINRPIHNPMSHPPRSRSPFVTLLLSSN
jgi:hypothetical protein